jgi:hypothetical protein
MRLIRRARRIGSVLTFAPANGATVDDSPDEFGSPR